MKLAIIGYGSRMRSITNEMKKINPDLEISAITDIRMSEIRDKMEGSKSAGGIMFYSDADAMLEAGGYDGVCVGTNCSTHAEYAVKVIRRKLPLYLEKPVATNMNDLLLLRDTYEQEGTAGENIVVSFPLRVTPLMDIVKEIIDSGRVGTIENVQAYNNVPYGGVYFHDWYRNEKETGGLFLQKATHDFDYLN